jgi:glycosyltransferase involved in cell wall biosynthesis
MHESILQSTVTIIMPAFNEEKTISNVISNTGEVLDCLGLPYEIIVVDDGSTDKTRLVASSHKVTMLSNDHNRGKGYCLRKAMGYAHGDIIVTIDSDGEHQPKEIPDLISHVLDGADIVAGSRFLGNSIEVTAKINRLGNSIFNFVIMALTGQQITDSQTGFRAIKRSVLERLCLQSDGYEIETEITVKGLKKGYVLKELPITCVRRKHGQSKIKILSDGRKIMSTIVRSSL